MKGLSSIFSSPFLERITFKSVSLYKAENSFKTFQQLAVILNDKSINLFDNSNIQFGSFLIVTESLKFNLRTTQIVTH